MEHTKITFDDDYPLDILLKSPIQEFLDDNELFGSQLQQFFSNDILPVPMPSQNLTSTMMPMPTPYDYEPNNLQILQNIHPQLEQSNNNSSHIVCCGTTTSAPDISTSQTSTHNRGFISAQERNEQLERYKYKKKRRDFSNKIKYACRKKLADSRPRVRGRFAKKNDTEQTTRICSTNFDELQYMARASTSNYVCNNVKAAANYDNLFGSFNFLDESKNKKFFEELGLI